MRPPVSAAAEPRTSIQTERSVGDPVNAPDMCEAMDSEAFMPKTSSMTPPTKSAIPTDLRVLILDASHECLTPLLLGDCLSHLEQLSPDGSRQDADRLCDVIALARDLVGRCIGEPIQMSLELASPVA